MSDLIGLTCLGHLLGNRNHARHPPVTLVQPDSTLVAPTHPRTIMLARPTTRLARPFLPPSGLPSALPLLRSLLSTSTPVLSPPKPPASPSPLPKKPSPAEPHLTPSELASKKLEETNTPPAPYLTRALGVPNRPTKVPQTKEEWRAGLLSREGRVEERRHL